MKNNKTSMSTNATSGVETHSGCDNNLLFQGIPDELCVLGRSGMDFVIYSHHLGRVQVVSYKELGDDKFLKTLLGIQFLQVNYLEQTGSIGSVSVNYDRLRMHIEVLGDYNKHQFDTSKVRGVGVYKSKDGYIINHGAAGVFRSNGERVHNCHDGYFYLPIGDLGISGVEIAGKDDLNMFYRVFSSFNFEGKNDQRILTGVVLSSMVSRALDHKPIVSLVAPPSSGKSTLLSALTTAIGRPSVQYADSKQNSAKIRALLTEGPTALLVDEFEAKTYRGESLNEMTSIFRASFSNTEDKAINNAIGCKSNKVRLDAQVFLAAVQLPHLEPADLSRMIKVQLNPYHRSKKPAFSSSSELLDTVERIAPKIRKLLISHIDELPMLVQAARKKLSSLGLIERVADKWSGVIACAMLAERVTTKQPSKANRMLKEMTSIVLGYETADSVSKDANMGRYATALLNGLIPAGPQGSLVSIRHCLSSFRECKTAKDIASLNSALKPLGLAITEHKNSGKWCLAVSGHKSHGHEGRFFSDTSGKVTPMEVCFADLAIDKQYAVTFGDLGTQRSFILPIDTLMGLGNQDMAA